MDRFIVLLTLSLFVCVTVEAKAALPRPRGCSEANFCCTGKNNTCRAYGPRLNYREDDDELAANEVQTPSCFCDSDCVKLGDCCTDYAQFCRAVDCVLSEEWGEWGLCSNPCGPGEKTRARQVVVEAQNGGVECPVAMETIRCVGDYNCKIARSSNTLELRETAKIIPALYASWRRNKMYNPFRDIRKNLFRHYSANEIIDRPAYYAMFEVKEARRSCQYGGSASPWAPRLKPGTRVCVECQDTAMKKSLGVRCKGHGVFQQVTRWNAIFAAGCHGTWEMKSERLEGSCDANNELAFIFV